MSVAIKFENISKQYRLGLVSTRTLSHDLNRWWSMNIRGKDDPYLKIGDTNDRATKGESEYVWALRDINLEVQQGEVLGIIGKNGAGKSTLLKILSKVTTPTTGTIKARGRIASLLEVGTGFHQEMTGRENIFMNGAIMGMSKAEITRKLDEIVDFAGVERYIDTPVKRYSSGMMVRLGFAVAAHLEPEILVVDEVLAVGDAEFQKKAIGKMQDVSRNDGRTVLFVSHNMGAIKNLCSRGIVLKNGEVSYTGTTEDAVDQYLNDTIQTALLVTPEDLINKRRLNFYSRDVGFLSITFNQNGNNFHSTDDIEIICSVVGNRDTHNFRFNATIFNNEEHAVGGFFGKEKFSIKEFEHKDFKITISNHNLVLGSYSISFSVGKGDFIEGMLDFDVILNILQFNIVGYDSSNSTSYSQWNKNWGNVLFKARCEEG